MKEQLLVDNAGLRAHLYYWASSLEAVSSLTICLPGIPSYPEKEFFEQLPSSLQTGAYLVLYYYGYWFSGGSFTVDSSAKSVVDGVAALRSGMFRDAFTFDEVPAFTGDISIIGYSFGANPLARALDLLDPAIIHRLHFVAPLGVVHRSQLINVDKDVLERFHAFNKQFVTFLDRGYNQVIRMQDIEEWGRYFQGSHDDSMVRLPKAFLEKSHLYYGKQDRLVAEPLFSAFAKLFDPAHVHIAEDSGHTKSLITTALLETTSLSPQT